MTHFKVCKDINNSEVSYFFWKGVNMYQNATDLQCLKDNFIAAKADLSKRFGGPSFKSTRSRVEQ